MTPEKKALIARAKRKIGEMGVAGGASARNGDAYRKMPFEEYKAARDRIDAWQRSTKRGKR